MTERWSLGLPDDGDMLSGEEPLDKGRREAAAGGGSTQRNPRYALFGAPLPTNGIVGGFHAQHERWRSRPISRVLSWTVIPLGASSPIRSSSLPGPDAGRVMRSLFGLAPGGVCRAGLLPGSRCALTAPFHPCHASHAFRQPDRSAVSFCCTFRRLAPPRRYLAPCPVEPGLSSAPARLRDPMTRLSGRLRRVHCRTRSMPRPYSLPYSALRGAPLSSAASFAADDGGRCSASLA